MKLLISVAMLTALSAPAYAYSYTDSRGYHHWCQSSCAQRHVRHAARHHYFRRHIRVVRDRQKFQEIDDEAQERPVDTVKVTKQVKEPPVEALQPEAPKVKENIRMIKPIVNEGRPPSWVGDIINPWAKRIEDR